MSHGDAVSADYRMGFAQGRDVGLATGRNEAAKRIIALETALRAILSEVSGNYDGWARDAMSVLSIRELAESALTSGERSKRVLAALAKVTGKETP